MGRSWYEMGRLAQKPTTFSDFVAVARALIARGWTTPQQLAARGGSAGGLLMGAVMNQAPELFRAVISEVPFVDVVTTMLDDSLPLTAGEWEEWGNPEASATSYRTMKSYSPYDNVRATRDDGTEIVYPHLYASGGLNDSRVGFWEPAKWVLKLRDANRGKHRGPQDRDGRGPRRSLRPLRRVARRGSGPRLASQRDHDVVVVVVERGGVKTSTSVAGSGEGKTTVRPFTMTLALEGEPIVMRESPVITSDSLFPTVTGPCHSRVLAGPML